MGVIVMVEPQTEHAPDLEAKSWVTGGLRAVHAALTDPDTPEDPADLTLCGKPTASMEKHSYHPQGPGATWYPPNLTPWQCTTCTQALRRS
ncbi:hypothetical protein [Streptacidiphilus rugosus]|uniref:hypothetical protein n=1 Tax=Streptacidiphilus rugosus TaxID=405783 RepID=UPI00056354D5|nr:hypothetical protein [Streptacidiphilus rugosus]